MPRSVRPMLAAAVIRRRVHTQAFARSQATALHSCAGVPKMQRPRVVAMVVFSALCGLVAAAQSAPQQPAPPPAAPATAPPGRGGGRGGPAVVSPQIEADRRVTFRILAPNATAVTVGGDINGSLVPDPNAAAPRAGTSWTSGREGRRHAGGHHGQRRDRRLERHDRAAGQAGRLALHVQRRWRHRR